MLWDRELGKVEKEQTIGVKRLLLQPCFFLSFGKFLNCKWSPPGLGFLASFSIPISVPFYYHQNCSAEAAFLKVTKFQVAKSR